VLLKHELAHWSRRDQRVRLIEVVAMVLLWWHPLVWIARRQIESCEERCCDAAATTGLPGQRRVYAEAILHTLDFLSEPLERNRSEVEARPLASGLSRLPIVKHRLQKIMRPMGLAGKNFHRTFITLASCAAACILLIWPISPAVSIQYSDPELTTVFADRPLGVKSTVEMEISRRVEK
jgi:beta-lactamase regulating signal transducer with metallopeptidase domain